MRRTRIFVCGSCEGPASLVEALAQESEFELVGVAQTAQESTSVLAGGHLGVILHATDAQRLPEDEIAVMREHGIDFVDATREEQLLAHLAQVNEGPLSDEGLRTFFTELLALVKDEVA